jgi:hypothetical protein
MEVRKSTLTRFVAGFDFVDHVNLAATADDLARRVTLLRRFDGGDNFHKGAKTPFAAGTVKENMAGISVFFRMASIQQRA